MRLKKSLTMVVAVAAVGGLPAACGHDTPEVPESLLSPEVVGGTPFTNIWDHLRTSNPCTLNNAELIGGANEKNSIGYERSIDGHTEYVVIGTYERAPVNTRLAFDQLGRDIASNKVCNTPPNHVARLHLTKTPKAFAFKASSHGTRFDHDSHSEKPWRKNILRSYTYLQQNFDDTMVLVAIERTDGTTPPTSELEDLTAKQVAKTKATLAAKA
ncbi:hypothetical protein AB3X52_13360 [Nocardioides sp. DS6]|uniref:DUF3558 domain-containing protein n=1 Tax=Nocardioides eburneus TaxID=3231482 RepID=A0ABV3T319_9ACTN